MYATLFMLHSKLSIPKLLCAGERGTWERVCFVQHSRNLSEHLHYTYTNPNSKGNYNQYICRKSAPTIYCISLRVQREPVWYLSEHLREVVDVGGAQGLGLETLGLQQVLGDVGRVDQHAVQEALLVPVRLEHDLGGGKASQ